MKNFIRLAFVATVVLSHSAFASCLLTYKDKKRCELPGSTCSLVGTLSDITVDLQLKVEKPDTTTYSAISVSGKVNQNKSSTTCDVVPFSSRSAVVNKYTGCDGHRVRYDFTNQYAEVGKTATLSDIFIIEVNDVVSRCIIRTINVPLQPKLKSEAPKPMKDFD